MDNQFMRGLAIVCATLLLTACQVVQPESEPVVIDSQGEVPFYARFGENETFSDDEHAVIVFYRPPECIPDNFNLVQFFHFPSDSDPGAFACGAPTTIAVETWQNGPDVDLAPLEAVVTGRGAVPVWFVAEPEFAEAMSDGVVTIGELEALSSLRTGTATIFDELLRPTQSNAAPLIQFSAEGTLESGEPFFVDVSKGASDVVNHVTINLDGQAIAPTVTFTATEYAYDGPESIPNGLTRIELVNAGNQEHMLWLAKLDEGKSFADIMEIFANYETHPQNPEWMVWYGGIGAGPGQSRAYTIELIPGSYALFSMRQGEDGVPDAAKGMQTMLTVTEGAEHEARGNDITSTIADLRTEMVDFSYIIEGIPNAGPQIIEIANTGMEAHEVVLLKLANGVAVQDALDYMMAGEEAEGSPPFEFSGGAGPMHAGLTAWYEADLEAGEYGLICFIGSPANDFAPHFMLGMARQVTVE